VKTEPSSLRPTIAKLRATLKGNREQRLFEAWLWRWLSLRGFDPEQFIDRRPFETAQRA
jgi:hypothetical protein